MEGLLASIELWMGGLGPWAYLAAPLLMALVAVLPIPAEGPAMLNGMLFGPVTGTVLTWSGAMLGAQLSFELARLLGRPAAERLLGSSALQKADGAVLSTGWWGLLAARFIPVVAFTALNWGAGLTSVSRWRFAWTTAVGIAPGAIIFTATGTGLAALLHRLRPAAAIIAAAVLVLGAIWYATSHCERSGPSP